MIRSPDGVVATIRAPMASREILFFGSPTKEPEPNNKGKYATDRVIYAKVSGEQTISNRDRLEMRLEKEATIQGISQKSNFVRLYKVFKEQDFY